MKRILIITGGSGGHVLPSLAIYDHIKDVNEVNILTDLRGSKFIPKNKYKYSLIDVPNLFARLYLFPIMLIKFLNSIFQSYKFLKKYKYDLIISTGGYMSIPICLSGYLLNKNILLFEPNSVLGRANKYMLSIAKKIICYDKNLKLFPKKYENKIFIIQPILRKEIYSHKKNISEEINKIKKILVIGGSQGAKFFDSNIYKLIAKTSQYFDIEVTQQIYDEKAKKNIEQVYNDKKIKYNLFSYNENLCEIYNEFDLAITRSGASAISELAYFNVPFVAIPFPFAKDNHQYFNALFYHKNNCCWIIDQKVFKIEDFSKFLFNLLSKKSDYFEKKKNQKKITNENSWNNINNILKKLINEN